MRLKVEFDGYQEVQKLLREIGDETLNRKVLLAAQRDALRPVVQQMKSNLTSSAKKGTGNLLNSIGVKALRGTAGSYSVTALAGVRIGLVYRGYHGHIINLGTKERYYKKARTIKFNVAGRTVIAESKGSGRVTATRFATKAIEQNQQKVMNDFEQLVQKSLFRYMKRTLKKGNKPLIVTK
jgi:hypothetical protein